MNNSAREIYRSYDEYGPIQVLDDGYKRYLAFGTDDEQSCQLINQPYLLQHEYTRAILLSLLLVEPKHITVIGIGGGTLLTTFHHLVPDCHLIGIELRPKVARLAQKYFQLPKHPGIKLHIGDGFDYLKNSEIKTDIIVADMYLADGIDQQQLSSQFIANAQMRLNQGGWLVLNYWLEHKMEDHLANALHDNFDQIYMCDSGGGNWVVFAGKVNINQSLINEDLIKPLSKAAGFAFNKFLKRLVVLT
jgi:spermidine synthase